MADPAQTLPPDTAPLPSRALPADGQALAPAELAARLRATVSGSFTGRAPLVAVDGGFRAARLDQFARVGADVEPAPPAPAAEPAPPPPDPARLLADARAEGFADGQVQGLARGRAEGHAEGRREAMAEAEAALGAARDAFAAALRGLAAAPAASDALAGMLADAVRTLAAQRAGQAIDALPAAFAARVAALADRVAQGMRTVTVRLHPDDLAAIAPHLAGTDLDGVTLSPDPHLSRGDVDVRGDGIVLSDLLAAP